jgi:hypothetical protein
MWSIEDCVLCSAFKEFYFWGKISQLHYLFFSKTKPTKILSKTANAWDHEIISIHLSMRNENLIIIMLCEYLWAVGRIFNYDFVKYCAKRWTGWPQGQRGIGIWSSSILQWFWLGFSIRKEALQTLSHPALLQTSKNIYVIMAIIKIVSYHIFLLVENFYLSFPYEIYFNFIFSLCLLNTVNYS